DTDALQVDEPDEAEGRGDPHGALELAGCPEVHRRRRVDDQVQAEIFLVDEELDVQAIEPAVDVPVDVAKIVADPVRAIVAELDAVPAPEASALALDPPAKDPAREQRQALELRKKVRREERLARRRHGSRPISARRAIGNSCGSGRGSRGGPVLA